MKKILLFELLTLTLSVSFATEYKRQEFSFEYPPSWQVSYDGPAPPLNWFLTLSPIYERAQPIFVSYERPGGNTTERCQSVQNLVANAIASQSAYVWRSATALSPEEMPAGVVLNTLYLPSTQGAGLIISTVCPIPGSEVITVITGGSSLEPVVRARAMILQTLTLTSQPALPLPQSSNSARKNSRYEGSYFSFDYPDAFRVDYDGPDTERTLQQLTHLVKLGTTRVSPYKLVVYYEDWGAGGKCSLAETLLMAKLGAMERLFWGPGISVSTDEAAAGSVTTRTFRGMSSNKAVTVSTICSSGGKYLAVAMVSDRGQLPEELDNVRSTIVKSVKFAGPVQQLSVVGRWGGEGNLMTLNADGTFVVSFLHSAVPGEHRGTYRLENGRLKFLYSRLFGSPRNPENTWDDCGYSLTSQTLRLKCTDSKNQRTSFDYNRM